MDGALAGVRVIDFTSGMAGAIATMHLADFGAEVIRIASAGRDPWTHPGSLRWDLGKRRLVPGDRTQLATLMAHADAAVFDAGPSALAAAGHDYATLAESFPGLLHVWMPPYGTTGAYSDLPADDALLSALTGAAGLQFSYADRPVWLVTPVLTYGHGTLGALAIAAGLRERRRSGRGQSLVVSGLHGFQAMQSSAVTAGDLFREARGSRGGIPNYQLYRCADDRWLFLATLSQPFFVKALEALDLLDLLTIDGIEGEMANLMVPPGRETATARLDERFAMKPRAEWLALLERQDVPCGAVLTRDEWVRSETVAASGPWVTIEHPDLGPVSMPGLPLGLSATPPALGGWPAAVLDETPGRRTTPMTATSGHEPRGPLAGVRVLDIGHALAGPFGPTVLAGLGADVIKVEPPGGDFYRAYGAGWSTCNRGKRSVVLDLRAPDGAEQFKDLARTADIVIDNFRPGVRRRLGVDYDTLSAINPGIITGSVTAFGTSGPLAGRPGFDPLLQAMSGLMDAQGGGGEPVFYQTAVNDHATALTIALGTVAALYARERIGRGQEVATSLTTQSLVFQMDELTAFSGRPAAPTGALDCLGISAYERLYEASDGWLAVSCRIPGERMRLLDTYWHEVNPPSGDTVDGPLAVAIAAAIGQRPRTEVLRELAAVGVPAAPALAVADMFCDSYLVENGVWAEFDGPGHGRATSVAAYAAWSRTPVDALGDAPALGAHNADVLR